MPLKPWREIAVPHEDVGRPYRIIPTTRLTARTNGIRRMTDMRYSPAPGAWGLTGVDGRHRAPDRLCCM